MSLKPPHYTPEQLAKHFNIPKADVFTHKETKTFKINFRHYNDDGTVTLQDTPPEGTPTSFFVVLYEDAVRFAELYHGTDDTRDELVEESCGDNAKSEVVLRRGDRVYEGRVDILKAFNLASGKKLTTYRTIYGYSKDLDLKITHVKTGDKEIPQLDHIDLLGFLDLLPKK